MRHRHPATRALLLGLLLTLVVAGVNGSIATLAIPSRAIPVYEETLKPGAAKTYSLWSYLPVESDAFAAKLSTASTECASKVSFSWTGGTLPTAAQRQEMCSCKLLIDQLQTVNVPRCTLIRGGELMTYAQFIAYSFQLCSLADSSPTAATPSPTIKSTTPPPPSPTFPPTTKKPVIEEATDPPTTTSPTTTPETQATDAPTSTTRPTTEATPSPITTTAPRTTSPRTATEDASTGRASASDSTTPIVIGIIGGLALCLAFAGFLVWTCRRQSDAQPAQDRRDLTDGLALSPIEGTTSKHSGFTYLTANTPGRSSRRRKASDPNTRSSTGGSKGGGKRAPSGMWDDPMIIAVRIPHDMIFFGPLLASGGFGEVYKGTYKGETVAIKQLLPARRKDLVQIDAFLGEIKLMSQLDHERIVKFIGVAWNSLSDACAVVEYMENGDLRSVLTRWDGECEGERRRQGFDQDRTPHRPRIDVLALVAACGRAS